MNKKTIVLVAVLGFLVACGPSEGDVIGVLDVDSKEHASFDETDARWLEKIVDLV